MWKRNREKTEKGNAKESDRVQVWGDKTDKKGLEKDLNVTKAVHAGVHGPMTSRSGKRK